MKTLLIIMAVILFNDENMKIMNYCLIIKEDGYEKDDGLNMV